MKRRQFIFTGLAGSIGVTSLSSFNTLSKSNPSNLKISITPWSLMRTGYGDNDPLGINVFDYPPNVNHPPNCQKPTSEGERWL